VAARPPDRRLAAAVASLLLAAPGMALAGPPYATDDPEPVEYRHWEVYLASQGTFAGGAFTGSAPHLEVNYGAAPGLQLHVIAPLVLAVGGGERGRYGPGDLELGVKVRFLDEDRAGVQVGTFPIVTLPTGSASRGLGAGGATVLLPIWLQKSAGPWTTYGGAGYRIRTAAGEADGWFLGWLLQRQVGLAALGAEVYRETSSGRTLAGRDGFDVGAVVDLSALHHLLLSIGAEGGPREVHAYLGWQLTFGPPGREAPEGADVSRDGAAATGAASR
jgi:hypothetical protein